MQIQNGVYISLGSNIEPQRHMADVIKKLKMLLGKPEISRIYQSPAVGINGNDFLNAVVSGTTTAPIDELRETLKRYETEAGRVRTANKFVDRTLDLDLLMFGDLIQTDSKDNHKITLPHPEIVEQAYVLQPLADIAGNLVHPTEGITVSELLARLKSDSPELFLSMQQVTLISQ